MDYIVNLLTYCIYNTHLYNKWHEINNHTVPTLARPARWAPWDSIYTRYWLKSLNSSMVGLKVMILQAGFAGALAPTPAILTSLSLSCLPEAQSADHTQCNYTSSSPYNKICTYTLVLQNIFHASDELSNHNKYAVVSW